MIVSTAISVANLRDTYSTRASREGLSKCEMLSQCCSGFCDAGPILTQHWLNVSCLLGREILCVISSRQSVDKSHSLCEDDKLDTIWNNDQMKWNESGFRPPLGTYRLNWARGTSWGWWDDWDDTVLQTQDLKFEPWRSEAEHFTSRSRRLPTILTGIMTNFDQT